MNLLRRFFLSSLLLAAGASAASIPGTFQQIDCEGGGWFEQVIPHPTTGRLYGRTDVGGLYRSDDHGDHWTFLSGDLPSMACHLVQGVAVAAGNDQIVWQAVGTSYSRDADDPGRGIWKSTDGGATWHQVLANVTFSGNDAQHWGGECIVVQPGSNDTELWAGSRGEGLYHSTDAGEHWSIVLDAKLKSPFRVSLKKPETNVLVCGILICPAISSPPAPERLWVYGDGGAWLSLDHGATWKKKITAARVYRMVQKPDGLAFAAAITAKKGGPKFWRIQPGNFAKVPAQAPNWALALKLTDIYVKRIAPAKTDPKGYLVAIDGKPALESHTATVQVLANGDLIASDLFENTCRSTDNGDYFTRLDMTLTGSIPGWIAPGVTTIDGGRNSLIQDPTLPSRLFLGGGYAPFRSDDGGDTWRFIHEGVSETVAWRANFDPANHNHVWLPLADLGCTLVKDAGASGDSSGYIAPDFPLDDIVMFTHRLLIGPGRVIAAGGEQTGHRARFYQTTDSGTTWTRLATDLSATGKSEVLDAVASPTNPNDVLVAIGGTGGVYRTLDITNAAGAAAGAKFTRALGLPGFENGSEFDTDVFLERDPTDANICYLLLRSKGFYTSSNGGSNWVLAPSQPDSTQGLVHVDPGTGRVWVGLLDDAGVGFGLQWRDAGSATWNTLAGVLSVSEFDVRDGRIAIIGQLTGDTYDHIYYSANSGATWGEITGTPGHRFATAQAVAVDPWRLGTVWISTNGRAIARFTPQ